MEGMAYINRDSAKAGAGYDVVGELRMDQKQPLSHKGVDKRFNVSNRQYSIGKIFSVSFEYFLTHQF